MDIDLEPFASKLIRDISNFNAKNLNFSASQLNFDWIENTLKFEFLAYDIMINLFPILFALKFDISRRV